MQGIPSIMSDEELAALRTSDEWRGFIGHPCYVRFAEAIRESLNEGWHDLLVGKLEDVERTRGWVNALNRVLEIAGVEIQNGQRVLDDRRRAEAGDFEEARAAQAVQQQRTVRRLRVGASLE